jgi:DNA-binding response OmpR family regulator
MKILLVMAKNHDTLDHASRLTEEGHVVEYCDTAQECFGISRKYAQTIPLTPFDVVIIDQDLLDMDGLELGKKIRKLHPDQRIIIISGSIQNTTSRIIREFQMPTQILQKPVSSHQLLHSLYDGGMYDELKKFKSEVSRIRKSAEIRKS